MYPFVLTPAVKDYIWGGTRLSREYGLDASGERQAEGWMLSCHEDGESVISNGALAGKTLCEVLKLYPELAGENAAGKAFPVLIKLIDARDDLSIQVHPNDGYPGLEPGESGKTEAWYIVDCEPGASLIYGFKRIMSKKEFRTAIEENTLMNAVNRVEVKKGDLFFIEAGTLHAIGRGILLAEVQQSSNTTYRVYDYGRLQNGKPRPLHIDKAVDVTVCEPPEGSSKPQGERTEHDGFFSTLLVQCGFFRCTLLEINGCCRDAADSSSFVSLLALEGKGTLVCGESSIEIKKGDSVFLPAGIGGFTITGALTALSTRI